MRRRRGRIARLVYAKFTVRQAILLRNEGVATAVGWKTVTFQQEDLPQPVTRRSVVARVIYAKCVVVQMIWQISRRAAVVVFCDSTTLSLSVGSQILWPMALL
jgi:hypothetical protein